MCVPPPSLLFAGLPEGHPGFKGAYFHHSAQGVGLEGGKVGGMLERFKWRGEEKGLVLPEKGPGAGVSRSGFANGAPFEDEGDYDLDHGQGTLSMVNGGGGNGSQFFINTSREGDFTSTKRNGEAVVFGKIVEGLEVVTLVGDLMMSPQWEALRCDEWLENCGHTEGGRPSDPVWIEAAAELKNYLAPTAKKNKYGRRKRGRARKGSITKRSKAEGGEEADGTEKKYASVVAGGDDEAESETDGPAAARAAARSPALPPPVSPVAAS